jgi:hypothetical protein
VIPAVLPFAYSQVGLPGSTAQQVGGPSSVRIVDGEYVAMFRTEVVRRVTEQEHRQFPNPVLRICSAWLAMMALFGLMNVPKPVK